MQSELKYPPFSLRLSDDVLTLKVVEDSDLVHMCALTSEDIFEPNCPWEFPWVRENSDTAQFHWSMRAGNKPSAWTLAFAAYKAGEFVGSIDMRGVGFAERRIIETGSYVLRKFQGQGLGKRMRSLVAGYAFEYLDAREMRSKWHPSNEASAGVSKALGYQVVGRTEFGENDRPEVHARLLRADFVAGPLEVAGHTGDLVKFLGA